MVAGMPSPQVTSLTAIPSSFWDEYRAQIEEDLVESRRDLALLETGKLRFKQRMSDGPWRDVSQDWIAFHKDAIATCEARLAALKQGRLL
jgi:hypothetical protein